MGVLQIKRGVSANVGAYTPLSGELVLDTTTYKLKIGDGVTQGGRDVSAGGSSSTADKLTTPRTIALSGEATGSTLFDGSSNVSIAVTVANKGSANGIATLDSSGKIPSAQLPSYVDDVLEFPNNAAFPATGETGKIYVNTTDNTTWRWSGSGYIAIASGAVQSVAGKTGVVTLVKADVGLGNVDNTADSAKVVASAAKLTTARNIAVSGAVTGTVSFDGSANVTIATTFGNVDLGVL